MKLAIVTAYPPSKLTLNEYAYHLIKHFRMQERVTEVVVLTDKTVEASTVAASEEGCAMRIVPCWKFNSMLNPISIVKTLKKEAPDAVLYNLQFMKFGDKKIPAALGLTTPMLSKWAKIPTTVLLHNIMETVDLEEAGFTESPLKKKIFGWIGTQLTRLVLQADKVAVTIDRYAEILTAKYNADNVVVIPHGTFEVPKDVAFKADYSKVQLMTFGKFGTYKKVEHLIEAVEKLRTEVPAKIELVIAGTDNPNVKGYLAGVEKQYAHVPGVKFTGYVAEEDVPVIFGDSDVVVFPYTATTGSSGVLHQAGSYGKAVVMPNIGDLADLVADEGYKGVYFEPGDVASLVTALKVLCIDKEYRLQLAKNNYEAAKALSMETISSKYLNLFESIDPQPKQTALAA